MAEEKVNGGAQPVAEKQKETPNVVQINQGNVAQLELQLMAQIRDELAGIRKALESGKSNA